MSTPFTGLMASMVRFLGMEASEADLESPVELKIDETSLVYTFEAPAGEPDLVLHASLGVISEAQELRAYRTLLEANLFWAGTADATIGVNSATREAFVAFRMPISQLDGERLANLTGHFIEVVELWQGYLRDLNQSGGTDTPTEMPEFPTGMLRA